MRSRRACALPARAGVPPRRPSDKPSMLVRGSAPGDTFRIPTSGLRVQEAAPDSFLSRFKALQLSPPSCPSISSSTSVQVSETSPASPAKTPEEEADEHEDNLISVSSSPSTPLDDVHRPSYPILRFCTSTALLDPKALDAIGLPLGFVWSPFAPVPNVHQVSADPVRCATCAAFLAKGNGAEALLNGSSLWTCAFCGRHDNSAPELVQRVQRGELVPELTDDIVSYATPDLTPPRPSSSQRPALVLIVDDNLDDLEAVWARQAVAAVRATALHKGMRFALLTVGDGCSIAMAPGHGTASAAAPVLEMMSVWRASRLNVSEKLEYFLDADASDTATKGVSTKSQQQNGSAATDAFISPRVHPYGKKNGKNDKTNGEVRVQEPVRLEVSMESRRLDIAISVAYELLGGVADSERSRIISLITGPPTTEPGKNSDAGLLQARYEAVGARAGQMGVALDFLVFGAAHGFGGQVVLAAAKRSRGGIVQCAVHSFSSGAALAEAAQYLAQRSTEPGVVSVRVSGPLMVGRVIGPAFPMKGSHTYGVPGVDPGVGFTVMVKAMEGLGGDHATLQLTARTGRRTRVVTGRIGVTRSTETFVRAVDMEVCAVVLGKACVVSSGGMTKKEVIREAIDACVGRLVKSGHECGMGVAKLLYDLRRGPVVQGHGHEDQSLMLRAVFARAEWVVSSLVMSARVFAVEGGKGTRGRGRGTGRGGMREVGRDAVQGVLEGMEAREGMVVVVVVDTGVDMFVYADADADADAETAWEIGEVVEKAREVARSRGFPCQLWKLEAGRGADFVLGTYVGVDSGTGFRGYCGRLLSVKL